MLRAIVGSVDERDEEDEGEEELRDGGVPFYVNRGGLPVDEETWERMWRHVARIHPTGDALEKRVRGATDLPKVPFLLNIYSSTGVSSQLCMRSHTPCDTDTQWKPPSVSAT